MTYRSELDLNYPTKAAVLWVENDEGYYRHWTERAQEMITAAGWLPSGRPSNSWIC